MSAQKPIRKRGGHQPTAQGPPPTGPPPKRPDARQSARPSGVTVGGRNPGDRWGTPTTNPAGSPRIWWWLSVARYNALKRERDVLAALVEQQQAQDDDLAEALIAAQNDREDALKRVEGLEARLRQKQRECDARHAEQVHLAEHVVPGLEARLQQAKEEPWQFTSEPATDARMPCLKPSHADLEAQLRGREAENERLRTALVEAAVALEPLRAEDARKPYREHSPEMRAQIIRATDTMRAALSAAGPAEEDR